MKILIRNQQRQRPINKTKIIKTARTILSLMEHPEAELSILFVGDRRMLRLNSQFRGIRKITDVLSFDARIPAGGDAENVLGDIVINISMVQTQAMARGVGLYEEIYRLLVHGILHLLGYDHEKSRYSAQVMRKKEKEILNAIKKIH